METNKFYALATVLDPRFKLCVFALVSASVSVRQMLMEECEQLAETEAPLLRNNPELLLNLVRIHLHQSLWNGPTLTN